MAKFRKKPIVIEAAQWPDGEPWPQGWLGAMDAWRLVAVTGDDVHLIIPTIEGDMRVSQGDWVIRGVKGEFYPCKPDIFDLTYEAVD